MNRLSKVNPDQATGAAKDLLGAVKTKLGMVPNMMRLMASSPAVLDAYLQFSGALAKGALSAKLREQIALAVGQVNGCEYCLAAHSAIGRMTGLTPEQIRDSRLGTAVEPKSAAAISLARRIVDLHGEVTDADIATARGAGLDDGAIGEVVANTALNIFTNYFNHVADSEIDFPAAPALQNSGTTDAELTASVRN